MRRWRRGSRKKSRRDRPCAAVAALLIAALLCVPLPASAAEGAAAGGLDQAQRLEDYEALWALLREDVPFVLAAMEAWGEDIDEVYARHRALVESAQTLLAFADAIAGCVAEAKGAGHLTVVTEPLWQTLRARQTAGREAPGFFDHPNTAAFYEAIGPQWRFTPKMRASVPPDPYPLAQINPYTYTCFFEDLRAAYVRFDALYDAGNLGQLYAFYQQLNAYDYLILDLSQAPGGLSHFWQEKIVGRLAADDFRYETYASYSLGENTLRFYEAGPDPRQAARVEETDPVYLAPHFQRTLTQIPSAAACLVRKSRTVRPDKTLSVRYAGRIFVLISPNTASAADEFAHFCKRTGFAALVGTRSGGSGVDTASYPVCYCMLPHSGLLVRYFPVMGFNADGSSNIAGGDEPDICAEGSALDRCLDEIRAMQAR